LIRRGELIVDKNPPDRQFGNVKINSMVLQHRQNWLHEFSALFKLKVKSLPPHAFGGG